MTKFVLLSEIVVQPNFRFLFSTKLTFSIDLVGSACVCVCARHMLSSLLLLLFGQPTSFQGSIACPWNAANSFWLITVFSKSVVKSGWFWFISKTFL